MFDPNAELPEIEVAEFPIPKIFEEHEEHIFWIGGTYTLFAAPFYPLTKKVKSDEIIKPLSATGLSAHRRQQFKDIKSRLMKRVYPA